MPPPPEIFKIEHSETPFPAFLRQGWSSLRFSLKSTIVKKENKKTPKYGFQSTGHGMRNDRTIRPASGLKRKPCTRQLNDPERAPQVG